MAQRKKRSKRPQPRHTKSQPSRPDKRRRLDTPNSRRRQTTRAKIPLVGGWLRRSGRWLGRWIGGWQSITSMCRGAEVTRESKTLLAMSHWVDGPLRVVLVRFEAGGWVPSF